MAEPRRTATESPSDEPVVDVAIVSWNTGAAAAEAAACFMSSRGIQSRVVVVDNDSAPQDRELLKATLQSGVDLLINPSNVGYGSAANAALAEGDAPLVCVSNADITFGPNQIRKLAEAASAEPRAGMVGPVFTGSTNAYHAKLPHPAQLLAGAFIGRLGRRRDATPPAGRIAEIGQVSGACFLMHRAVWERIGGFDGGFFLWYDDVDLAKRLTDAGYKNLVVGSSRVSHGGAVSFAQIPRRKAQEIRLRSLTRYLQKHHPRAHRLSRPIMLSARRIRAR